MIIIDHCCFYGWKKKKFLLVIKNEKSAYEFFGACKDAHKSPRWIVIAKFLNGIVNFLTAQKMRNFRLSDIFLSGGCMVQERSHSCKFKFLISVLQLSL